MTPGTPRTRRMVIAIAWTIALCGLLWAPPPPHPRFEFPHLDKLIHLGLFVGFGITWARAGLSVRAVLLAALGTAVATEVGQAWLPWPRSADAWDALADLVGASLGVAVVTWRRGATRSRRA